MDNTAQSTYGDRSKNLGQTLIEWIKRVNEKKGRKNYVTEKSPYATGKSPQIKKSSDFMYNELLSVRLISSDTNNWRKTRYYH